MANTTDMMAVGSDALAEVRDWVKEKTATDAALDQNSENAIQNKAVAAALQDYPKKADISGYLGAVLKITFDSEFAGQVYAVTGGGESYSGTVPAELVVRQTVQPEGLTTYTISATATGEAEASAITQDVQYYGVYPVDLHAVPPAPPFEIVSWAEGTDEQIAALIAAADAGAVDLAADAGWKVGDIRTLTVGAMAATGVGETHAAQTIRLVLSHAGETAGITRADGGAMHFQVDQIDELSESGYMNSTNTNSGSWEGSARRKWCNEVYYNAIPETLRAIFKKMKVTTAETYNGSTVKESEDFFSFRAEKEIFGTRSYSNATEFAALEQVEWYKTSANRIKKRGNGGSANYWWERSPYSSDSTRFCGVYSNGGASNDTASITAGLAPFGCI